MYEPNPNETTLWENKFKNSDDHPTKTGQLLLSRELLLELCKQQGKGGDFLINISAWEKTTRSGKPIINIKLEKPHKFDKSSSPPPTPQPHRSGAIVETDRGGIAFTEYRQPEPPTKPAPNPERYLEALKVKIAKIENYPQFEKLYEKVKSPESWEVFQSVPAIALEAGEILSRKKAELVLATEPVDLSAIISEIDVQCDRLKLPKKEHCLARWNKSRAMLTEAELMIYLDELKAAEPAKSDDDFF